MPDTSTSMGIRDRLHALAQIRSQEVEAPTSLHSQAQQQPLDANFVPRASQRRAIGAAPAIRPLCPGFRASITRRPRAPEHEMAARGGAEAGRPGAAPTPDSRLGAPSAPLRRRTARRAFPRSLRRAPGHKGLEGKHGARPASTERLAVRSGLDWTPGAGAGLAGTASSGASWGVVQRSFPSLRPPSTAITASWAGWGGSGALGRTLAATAGGFGASILPRAL